MTKWRCFWILMKIRCDFWFTYLWSDLFTRILYEKFRGKYQVSELISFLHALTVSGLCNNFTFIKAGLSPFKKNLCHLLDWKPFKNDEKSFLFHLKSSLRCPDIQVFVTTFWSCTKNGLIRKIRVTSKSMRHNVVYKQLEYLTCIPQYLKSKGNQTMRFGQLIEYDKINIFLQKLWGRETNSRPVFIFWKSLRWDESKRSAA